MSHQLLHQQLQQAGKRFGRLTTAASSPRDRPRGGQGFVLVVTGTEYVLRNDLEPFLLVGVHIYLGGSSQGDEPGWRNTHQRQRETRTTKTKHLYETSPITTTTTTTSNLSIIYSRNDASPTRSQPHPLPTLGRRVGLSLPDHPG